MDQHMQDGSFFSINPFFKRSFIFYSSIIGVISLCIFYFAITYFFWSFEQKGMSLGIPANHVFYKFINEQRYSMNVIFAIVGIFVLAINSISAFVVAQKILRPNLEGKK